MDNIINTLELIVDKEWTEQHESNWKGTGTQTQTWTVDLTTAKQVIVILHCSQVTDSSKTVTMTYKYSDDNSTWTTVPVTTFIGGNNSSTFGYVISTTKHRYHYIEIKRESSGSSGCAVAYQIFYPND